MTFSKITTAGAGTMGSQVAWQMAFYGKQVTVYDAIPAGFEQGKAFHQEYARHFIEQRGATQEEIDGVFARLTYTTDLAAAVREAELVSESVPETLTIKESFWREASEHAPAGTVFTTNTSTLAPSHLANFVDRPERFLALHFAVGVWDANIGEVMGHPGTDSDIFDDVLRFAKEIGLVPIPLLKEQSGYVINSLLVPWCTAALESPGKRSERCREHRSHLDDHYADRDGALRNDRSHGPRRRSSRRGAARREHLERRSARVSSLPR